MYRYLREAAIFNIFDEPPPITIKVTTFKHSKKINRLKKSLAADKLIAKNTLYMNRQMSKKPSWFNAPPKI